MVLSRCATITVVVCSPTSFKFCIMSYSVSESREDVGSSQSKMGAFLRMARAIATRCFSPPDNLRPRSPTTVSYPSGKDMIISWMRAFLAASTTSSQEASKSPY
mmetsp:Transcript_18677/g.31924  ORF Transcript_18677/g.31924 Transcript_18677/m.31924 type:complete len:104 (+) Transcript_18677:953-1264(+)